MDVARPVSDSRKQWLRVKVPSTSTSDFEWRRTGSVVTLGQLFMILGKTHNNAAIYYLYRTLRIVALKKRKTSAAAGAPGKSWKATSRRVGAVVIKILSLSKCRKSLVDCRIL